MSLRSIRFHFFLYTSSAALTLVVACALPSNAADANRGPTAPSVAAATNGAGVDGDKAKAKKQAAPDEKPSNASKPTDAKSDAKTPTKADAKKGDAAKSKADVKNDTANAKPKINAVGEPLAPGIVKLAQDEIFNGIQNRGIRDRYARFQSYAAGRVSATAGKYTGSELTGNCRIRWYDHLMRNALKAPAESERFTRQLHVAALNPHDGFAKVLAIASEKMDAGVRKPHVAPAVKSPEQALDLIKHSLTEAQVAYCAALAPLSKSEIQELQNYLVPVLSTQNQVGHTINDRGTGRRLCDLMEKMDRAALYSAAEALAPITDVAVLEQLKSLPDKGDVRVAGATGSIASKIDTPSGAIVIGGKGNNTYQLDQMRDVAVLIDLGGQDTYVDGAVDVDRPVLLVADLSGNDNYRGTKPGIQGAAILGVSVLLDFNGDDVYQAQDVAQGSALGGMGILIDYAGNDRYVGVRRVQGNAVGGVGIVIDRAGNDDYKAAMWGQGVGGPIGFGMLDDLAGTDHYYCGGMWRDSYYPETPGYEGWGQGVGGGIRQVASGGIGVILDGAGDDVYEFDYLGHGGGYWCGLGFARDFGGNDQRLITRQAYNGGPRAYASFQRFGCGWGCHYALGFCFDDAGNDVYEGTIMGTGMAWDCSMGMLTDFAGDDQYKATGGLTQGNGAQMGLGVLYDYRGNDTYEGYGQGYAPGGISYHHLPECGGNFSFVIDYAGKDDYGCGAENNSYVQRGDQGGFLIDRPGRDEVEPAAASVKSSSKASGG